MFQTSGNVPRFHSRGRCSESPLEAWWLPWISSVKWATVTTAWRFLRLMVERPPDMEGNCEYIEWAVAGIRQAVVLQLRGLDEALESSRVKLTILRSIPQDPGPLVYLGVLTLRLCRGRTAHRGSRVIALLFLDHGIRRGWGVSFTPRPLFTPGKDPVPIVQEAGWVPGPVWTGAENLSPTGIRSPIRPAHSQ